MSHTNLLYHIVFGTKGRYPFITDELKPRLHEYLGGTVRGLGGIAFEVNGMSDHVHLLAKIKSTKAIADVIRDLKANSAKWARGLTNGRFGWQKRYGAFTVSESQFEVVRKYIRDQEEHHKRFDFRYEYESLLKANKIEIDEKLWID